MIEIRVKDTSIRITVDNLDDLFNVYHAFKHQSLIINGEEIETAGPKDIDNPKVNTYFCGYTREYFKKYFEV